MKYCIETNVGVVRSENQDRASVFEKENIIFAILCDGMGGHEGGVHASRITIDVFGEEFEKTFPAFKEEYSVWFRDTLSLVKRKMAAFANGDSKLMDMGTTVTSAIITKDTIYIFNVGDSRTYIYNGLLYQITVDHNIRNYFIEEYNYTSEEASTIQGAAALTSALGPTKKTRMEQFKVKNDASIKNIILTSDGIHDFIEKPVMEMIIASDNPLDKRAELLITNAINGKSTDNLTVVLLEEN